MNDPRHQLTPEIQRQICGFILSGTFPHVAAEAAGVPQKVFERWMKWGRAARPVPLYRDFYEAVCQAQAQARLVAENHAFTHATITWLKSGPGKETARAPGWTSPVRPRPLPEVPRQMSVDRLQTLITVLLTALKPFPEARAAAADALDAYDWGKEPMGEPLPELAPPAPATAASLPEKGEGEAAAEPHRKARQEPRPPGEWNRPAAEEARQEPRPPGEGIRPAAEEARQEPHHPGAVPSGTGLESADAQGARCAETGEEKSGLEGLFVPRVPGIEFKTLGAVPHWPAVGFGEASSICWKGAANLQPNNNEAAANPHSAGTESAANEAFPEGCSVANAGQISTVFGANGWVGHSFMEEGLLSLGWGRCAKNGNPLSVPKADDYTGQHSHSSISPSRGRLADAGNQDRVSALQQAPQDDRARADRRPLPVPGLPAVVQRPGEGFPDAARTGVRPAEAANAAGAGAGDTVVRVFAPCPGGSTHSGSADGRPVL